MLSGGTLAVGVLPSLGRTSSPCSFCSGRTEDRGQIFWTDADRQRFLGQLADTTHTGGSRRGLAPSDPAVAAHYGVEVEDLERCRAGDGAAKFVAVELACRLTGMTQRAIGPHYGNITSAAVSNIRRRLRQGQYPLGTVLEELSCRLTSVSS
jgi:hypothetical protein